MAMFRIKKYSYVSLPGMDNAEYRYGEIIILHKNEANCVINFVTVSERIIMMQSK